MRNFKTSTLPKLQLVGSINLMTPKWCSTKKTRSTWSIISRRTKCRIRRETLMILRLFQNRELIRLLRTSRKLLNQRSNKLIQVHINKMSLQLLKLSLYKMTRLMTWLNQQKKVHLSLSGNKSKNKAKQKRSCLMHKIKTVHSKTSTTHWKKIMMEVFPFTGSMPMKKITVLTSTFSVKCGNQRPTPSSPVPLRLKAWRELSSLFQRWRPTKPEAVLAKKRKQPFNKAWLLSSITWERIDSRTSKDSNASSFPESIASRCQSVTENTSSWRLSIQQRTHHFQLTWLETPSKPYSVPIKACSSCSCWRERLRVHAG